MDMEEWTMVRRDPTDRKRILRVEKAYEKMEV